MIKKAMLPLMAVLALMHGTNGHAVLTKASIASQTACAVNANDPQCQATGSLRLREVIPRSGNTGQCAIAPGCEANFKVCLSKKSLSLSQDIL